MVDGITDSVICLKQIREQSLVRLLTPSYF